MCTPRKFLSRRRILHGALLGAPIAIGLPRLEAMLDAQRPGLRRRQAPAPPLRGVGLGQRRAPGALGAQADRQPVGAERRAGAAGPGEAAPDGGERLRPAVRRAAARLGQHRADDRRPAGGRGRRHLHRPARRRSISWWPASWPTRRRCARWRSASTTARRTSAAPPSTGGRTTAPTAPTAACTAAARCSTACSGTSPAATPAAPRAAMRERQSVLDAVVADAQQAEPGPGRAAIAPAWTSTWRRSARWSGGSPGGGRWCARRRRRPRTT